MLQAAGEFLWQGAKDFLYFMLFMMVIVLVVEGYKELRKVVSRRRRFISSFVTQEVVTARLREMARDLKALFDEQVRIQNEEHSSYVLREKATQDIAEKIAEAKKEFWANVELAADLKFEVPITIENALNGLVEVTLKGVNLFAPHQPPQRI